LFRVQKLFYGKDIKGFDTLRILIYFIKTTKFLGFQNLARQFSVDVLISQIMED
jgi:hypothetical protein